MLEAISKITGVEIDLSKLEEIAENYRGLYAKIFGERAFKPSFAGGIYR